MGAGGLWMPYKCEDKRVDKWAKDTLDELLHLCTLEKEKSDSNRPLVEIVPALYLKNTHQGTVVDDIKNFGAKDYCADKGNKMSPLPEWTKDSRIAFQHLTIEMLEWQNHVLKLKIPSIDVMRNAGYNYGWLFKPPIVDAPNMLMVSKGVVSLCTNTRPTWMEGMFNVFLQLTFFPTRRTCWKKFRHTL